MTKKVSNKEESEKQQQSKKKSFVNEGINEVLLLLNQTCLDL